MMGLHKFNYKTICFAMLSFAFSIAITQTGKASGLPRNQIYNTLSADTVPIRNVRDTIPLRRNRDTTLLKDTTRRQKIDTFSVKIARDTLDAPINYEAEDSAVIFVKEQKFLLYGKTKTTHKDMTLTAPRLMVDNQANLVTAYSSRDSLGNMATRARLTQGTQNFESDTINFDMKTQRGLTKNTFTKQNEMFVNATVLKKVNENTVFIKRGILTTCDYDEPHFGFVGNRMKIINSKIAVTGPIHPEFEGVPIPIYLPFGIFPLTQGRHSGLLAPQFTVNQQYGLGLEGLGYYSVLSENFDVTLRSNLYSYGGWALNLTPSYRKRYKFNGILNLAIQHTKINFKGDPDFQSSNTFNITWNHSVDSKARPGTTFSANVNAGSTKFNQFVANNPLRNVMNNQTSSISYSKTWAGTPFNLTMSANENQNSNQHQIYITLPDAGFTMTTVYPFQKSEEVGTPKWFEKLGIGYQGVFRNQVAFIDTLKNSVAHLLDTLQWGAQHRFPISFTLPPVGPLIITPGISYEQTWLTQRAQHRWNNVKQKVDTISKQKGMFIDQHASFNLSMSTALYGTHQFKHGRIQAIRHVIRPSFGFNYTPNFSDKYYNVIQTDSFGHTQAVSQFRENNIFQPYGFGRFGGITFGIDNNVEMKWLSKKDTGSAAIKKIRLIDGFGFSSAYNFLDTAFKLQPFSLYLRSTIGKINITATANLDPYQLDINGQRINRFTWSGGLPFSFGRITSAQLAISSSFQSKPRDASKAPVTNPLQHINDPTLLQDRQTLVEYMHRNPAEFVDFNVPWTLNISYSLSYSKQPLANFRDTSFVTSGFSFNNSFSLTPKWNFSTNGFFDFRTNQLSLFTMSISRDMHCWQMSINVTPVGPIKSFNITLNPKASILQDLKVNRTRTYYNY